MISAARQRPPALQRAILATALAVTTTGLFPAWRADADSHPTSNSIVDNTPSSKSLEMPIKRIPLAEAAKKRLSSLDQDWFYELGEGAPLVQANVRRDGSIAINYVHPKMPRDHVEAFAFALASKSVQEAARLKRVKRFVLRSGYVDGGAFDPKKSEVELSVWNVFDPLFKDPIAYDVIALHEAHHALNRVWDDHLGEGRNMPRRFRDRANRVTAMCRDITTSSIETYLQNNWRPLNFNLHKVATSLEGFRSKHPEMSGQDQDQITKSAQALRSAAIGVWKRRNKILNEVRNDGCHFPTFERILEIAAGKPKTKRITESDVWKGIYIDARSYRPLNGERRALLELAEQPFACMTDGQAIREIRPNHDPSQGGHPWDSPTEVASTLAVVNVLAPKYYASCMKQLDENNPDVFRYVEEVRKLAEAATPSLRLSVAKDGLGYATLFGR